MRLAELECRVDPLRLAGHPDLRRAGAVAVRGWTIVVGEPLEVLEGLAAFDRVDALCGSLPAPTPGAPPFAAGAVGWVADDVAADLLRLGPRGRPASATAGVRLGLHDTAVCIDGEGRAWVAGADLPVTREPWDARVGRWRALAASCPPIARTAPPARPARLSLEPDAHARRVARAKGWIAAGDLYQLNLTLQISVGWPFGGAVLADRLWAASAGAAHACWLREPDVDVVSVSPETFLRVRGRTIVTRPIKGTRPRSADPALDRAAAEALAASTKDSAEHVMIVDLSRNDLGRVCETGSVEVPELAALERHPTVWHLTSTVAGRLREGVTTRQVVEATFPPGSVTGAPKRMAWSRIGQLEPVERGVYCGAIGVVGPGMLDLSVAIRTAVLADGVASYGAGGGIVADSEEAAEFTEAMDKARAFATATGAVLPEARPPSPER
jgi:para-aminobenzoate synthetase component 1